jgi:glycerophosphoryl diester phosphodiesterase
MPTTTSRSSGPDAPTRPLILGHRGAPLEAPENTLAAFRLAVEQGADGVELDVQRSRDGVPVVIHDETLERTAGVAGAVADLSWAELARLGGGEAVPSLERALEWAADAGAWVNVEIKAPGVEEATLAAVARAGMRRRVIVSSFDPGIVRRVGVLAPDVHLYLLSEEWEDTLPRRAAECGARGVCLGVDAATPVALRRLAAESLPVVVWTVNDADRMRALLRGGVAGLITNRPAVAAQVRRESAGC